MDVRLTVLNLISVLLLTLLFSGVSESIFCKCFSIGLDDSFFAAMTLGD